MNSSSFSTNVSMQSIVSAFMQELVYFVNNAIIIKKAISKEGIKIADSPTMTINKNKMAVNKS